MIAFTEFLRERYGQWWVVASRLTPRLKQVGYTVALPPSKYAALRLEWERQVYGAPLAALESNAPQLFAALDEALKDSEGYARTVEPRSRRAVRLRCDKYRNLLNSVRDGAEVHA